MRDVLLIGPRHVVEDIEELIELESLVDGFIVEYGRFGLRIVGRSLGGILRVVVPGSVPFSVYTSSRFW